MGEATVAAETRPRESAKGRISTWVLRVLRVPTEPTIPAGSTQALVFRASPRYYRYRLILWALVQLGAAAGLVAGLVFISTMIGQVGNRWVVTLLRGAELLAWLAFLVQLPFSFVVLRLDFELRWYILSDRSLRIREGIISMHEKTMTFANIQQISIRQNPVQRLLGIADVQVRSAGGGGGSKSDPKSGLGESMHEAWFRGVDNAETIRSAIRERVRLHRDSGLGDPDERGRGDYDPPAPADGVLDAARELRREMSQLHRQITARRGTP
jgi:membrane protein YdbS with pleckstrin-like domain